MTIRTRLTLSAIICIGLALFLTVFLSLTAQQIREATEKYRLANELTKGISELQILTTDYLLNYGERAEMQWYQKHDLLTKRLVAGEDPEEKVIYDSISHRYEHIINIFTQLITTIKERQQLGSEGTGLYEERENRLVGQLLIESQVVVSDAYELQLLAQTRLDAAQRRGILTVIGFTSAIAAVVVAVFLWIRRSVLSPLGKLQVGTEKIGSGNLDYKVGTKAKDEIGQLSRAFDQMTEGLKTSLTSVGNLTREIAERKRVEAELEDLLEREAKSVREWQETFDAVTDIVTVISTRHELLRINRAGCRAMGKKPEELIGKKCYEVVHGLGAPIKECPCVEALKTKKSLTSEFTEQGRHYLLTAYPIFDEGGEIVSFVHIVGDITERKQAEEDLRETRDYLNSLLQYANAPIIVWDTAQRITIFNTAFERLTGYVAGEVTGQPLSMLFPEASRDESLAKIRKTLSGEYWELVEIPILRKDGEIRIALWNSANIYDKDGKTLLATIVQGQDITERKQVEEKIKRAAEEWRTTFDSITDFVSICDKDFKLTRVNKAFADVFKMKPVELVGKHCYEIVHGTNEPISNCAQKVTIKTKKPATAEFFEPHLGIHLEMTTSPIFSEKGEVVACVHVARDITERKQMEEQLIVTDRLASIGELASGIAHELNNPLTSVIGFSQLLLDKDVSDDVKEDVKIIYSEAQRTAAVVKNLLTFARKHTPVKQPVNINDIIDKVLELRTYEQKVSNIQVNTQFAPDLPEIMADFFQLQQVFLNIVINAEHFMIEAHNRGTLTITTERAGDVIKVSFADDGPGIAKKNLGHLFDPFFTTKEVGKGTGLGLSICHGIVTEHGGRIYAESKLGKGATFVVELPIAIDKKGTVK